MDGSDLEEVEISNLKAVAASRKGRETLLRKKKSFKIRRKSKKLVLDLIKVRR